MLCILKGRVKDRIYGTPADYVLRELIYESLKQFRVYYLRALTCGQSSSHSQLSIPLCLSTLPFLLKEQSKCLSTSV